MSAPISMDGLRRSDDLQTPSPERAMWCAAFLYFVEDLCGVRAFKVYGDGRRVPTEARLEALAYLGSYPSRDFRAFCALAGLDPDAAYERLTDMAHWSEDRRQAWIAGVGREPSAVLAERTRAALSMRRSRASGRIAA